MEEFIVLANKADAALRPAWVDVSGSKSAYKSWADECSIVLKRFQGMLSSKKVAGAVAELAVQDA